MKASIKFRDEHKPLMRAKVPIKMMSLPFQSGVVWGESKEMSLNLSTSFDSGPCFKFSYKPNDSQSPFSFVSKTGIGHFGSPNSSPFVMSAEFNLLGSQNPRFFLHFKPRFGDFSAKKSCSSVDFVKEAKGVAPPQGVVKSGLGFTENGFFGNGKVGVFPVDSAAAETAAGVVESVFSGVKVCARTVLPVGKRAAVNLRWGVRVPPEGVAAGDMVVVGGKGDPTAGISFKRIPFPFLVVDKIGIEHVAGGDSKGAKMGPGLGLPGNADVAEVCLDMKKQLEVIQAENGLLRKALDDLRSDIAAGKLNLSFGGGRGGADVSKYSGGGRADRRDKKSNEMNGSFGGKVAEGDMNEELKKALLVASGA